MFGLIVVAKVQLAMCEVVLDSVRLAVQTQRFLESAVSRGRAEARGLAAQPRGVLAQPVRLLLIGAVRGAEPGDGAVKLGQSPAVVRQRALAVVPGADEPRVGLPGIHRFQCGRHHIELIGRIDHAQKHGAASLLPGLERHGGGLGE